METTRIEERMSLTAGRVNKAAGRVTGIKILGGVSLNGRTYTESAIREAAPLYEGAKVNINHASGNPTAGRNYQDRFGRIVNVVVSADGLRGDLHYNPKHALAEQFAWDAEHSPEAVGMSHSIDGRTTKRDGKVVVEQIVKVHSVDLVADPATVAGLYESREQPTPDPSVELYRNPTPEETTEFVRDVCR